MNTGGQEGRLRLAPSYVSLAYNVSAEEERWWAEAF